MEAEVRLIECTHYADILCAAAAKLCHEPDERSFTEMMTWLEEHPDHVKRVLEMVIKMGHTSTLEHASFTFYLGNVSRALTHQLVRHRMASYSQQSQRHVDMESFEYVVPPDIGDNPLMRAEFRKLMDSVREGYKILREAKVNKEDARFLLPNACTTKIVVTMNARSLHNFFELRTSAHAQWEIRGVAVEMLRQVSMVAPTIFAKFESVLVEKFGADWRVKV